MFLLSELFVTLASGFFVNRFQCCRSCEAYRFFVRLVEPIWILIFVNFSCYIQYFVSFQFYPDHSFATPARPPSPSEKKWMPKTWLADTDPASILELVGPKLLNSFSLWDLLVRKVSYRCLGTVEILSSLFADIQALVMDLKNLAEQCLTSQRPNVDSFSVTLSPMMSSILGQSRNGGGVERFVLPYNQIPVHYHKLLGFPTGLRHVPRTTAAASTTCADIFSPDSTNSIFQPDEDNMSQMSLSSDILDRPLGDKVVLEENLGARQRPDMDEEETQDSSIAGHHDDDDDRDSRRLAKRARMDSESSPPPFLHEEESNISSTSHTGLKEHREDEKSDSSPGKAENSVDSLVSTVANSEIILTGSSPSSFATAAADSALARLPSFSSIINGKTVDTNGVGVGGDGGDADCDHSGGSTLGQQPQQHQSDNLPPSPNSLLLNAESGGGRALKGMMQQNGEGQLRLNDGHPMVGGSAPNSPHQGLEYLRSRLDPGETNVSAGESGGMVTSFQRRSSLDVSTASILNRLCEAGKQEAEETMERHSCGEMFTNPILHATPAANLVPSSEAPTMGVEAGQVQCRSFSFVRESRPDMGHKLGGSNNTSMPSIVTSPFQNVCDNAVFNVTSASLLYAGAIPSSSFLDTAPKEHGVAAKPFTGSLGHIYQDGVAMPRPVCHNTSRGKVLPGPQNSSSKRGALFSSAESDHNHLHNHNHQEGSASPFLAHTKGPSSPSGGRSNHHRLHEFDCTTQVTYSGELYHPIPSVSPVKDALKEFDCGKRLRRTPPTSQSPSLFNDLESVLSDDFTFHSALSNNVENVPAKTPEKLLASVPPSVIMNNKKASSVEYGNFAEFGKEPPRSDSMAAVLETDHSGTLKNGSANFVVSCQENSML